MTRLRLSHTFLLLWSQGRYNDALNAYYHKPIVRTRQMDDGIKWHEKWANEIQTKAKVKLGNTTFKFKSPKVEWKNIVPYNDLFDLSGTFDCVDGGDIYEWKTGKMSALEYAQGYQLGIYFVIAKIANLPIDYGILAHYNQYTDKADIVTVWNTGREREKADNFISSLAPEIHQYFIDNNLSFDKN